MAYAVILALRRLTEQEVVALKLAQTASVSPGKG